MIAARNVNQLVTILLVGLSLVLTLPGAEAAEVYRRFNIIFIKGELQTGDAAALEQLLRDGGTQREFVVSSPGGNTVEALKLGRQIRESKLPLRVRDYCVSSCAMFIFTAGSRSAIDRGAFVAFHVGTEGVLLKAMPFLDAHKGSTAQEDTRFHDELERLHREFEQISSLQQKELRLNGVRSTLRDELLAVTGPSQVEVSVVESPRNIDITVARPGLCDYWVPDAIGLYDIGVNTSGYVRPAVERLSEVLRAERSRIFLGLLPKAGEANEVANCERE